MAEKKYRFKKLVFRVTVIVMVIYAFGLGMAYGIKPYYYINCPVENPVDCVNPVAGCLTTENTFKQISLGCDQYKAVIDYCKETNSQICIEETIQPGKHIGDLPPFFIKFGHLFLFLIVALGFLVNHILYNRGYKYAD